MQNGKYLNELVPSEDMRLIEVLFDHYFDSKTEDEPNIEEAYGNSMIGIDCGSGYPEEGKDSEYGRLACLRLDDGEVFYSEEERYDH